MTEQVSIWRWAVTDDLDGLFVRLVAASEDEFSQIALEIESGAPGTPSVDQIEAETEARLRAMDLPADIMATMLSGYKSMMEEARAEQQAPDEDAVMPDAQGRMTVALASSHMFYDEPHASLAYEVIASQVAEKLTAYASAISAAVGDAGQSLGEFLGVSGNVDGQDAVIDVLVETDLAAVAWVWVVGDVTFFLSQWHEDKELPIDLEFGRAPRAVFDAARAEIATSYEL